MLIYKIINTNIIIYNTEFAATSMWERLTAPEDCFSKLQRENLAIIESYGTALMEVVCRDACDGHEIGRVRGNNHHHHHLAWSMRNERKTSKCLLS